MKTSRRILISGFVLFLFNAFSASCLFAQFRIEKIERTIGNERVTRDTLIVDMNAPPNLVKIIRHVNLAGDSLLLGSGRLDLHDSHAVSTDLEFRLNRFDSLFTGRWQMSDYNGWNVRNRVAGVNFRLRSAKAITSHEAIKPGSEKLVAELVRARYPQIESLHLTREDLEFVIEGSQIRYYVWMPGNTFEEVVIAFE